MDTLLFWLFGATAVASGLLAVTRKNAVASAIWLVVLFFGLAGTFVLLEAYFVAAVQILVYAGAIMVLFLFVIMLLDLRSDELRSHAGPRLKLPGILLAAAFLWAVVTVVRSAATSAAVADRVSAQVLLAAPPPPPPDPTTGALPPAPPAPPPAALPLEERRFEDLPLAPDLRPAFVEGNLAGARARVGTLRVPSAVLAPPGPAPAGEVERALVVVLPVVREGVPGPTMLAFLDRDGDGLVGTAEVLPPEGPPKVEGRTERTRHAIGFEGGLPAVAVAVQRGGLDAYDAGAVDGSPRGIGRSLFDDWILPFEVTSVLLLGAIFGAVVLTKRRLS